MVKSVRASVTWMFDYEKMEASYRSDYRGLLIFLCNSQGLANSPYLFSYSMYLCVCERREYVSKIYRYKYLVFFLPVGTVGDDFIFARPLFFLTLLHSSSWRYMWQPSAGMNLGSFTEVVEIALVCMSKAVALCLTVPGVHFPHHWWSPLWISQLIRTVENNRQLPIRQA